MQRKQVNADVNSEVIQMDSDLDISGENVEDSTLSIINIMISILCLHKIE